MDNNQKSSSLVVEDSPPPDPQAFEYQCNYDMNLVHVELEKLNIATDVINKLEVQLDEARACFREIQTSWTLKLEQLLKKLGNCIEKSRPYYEARMQAKDGQQEAQKAAIRFERANSMHAIAKEQVNLTQESLARQGARNVEPACLEVLNHHIGRVNDAERERLESEQEHWHKSKQYEEALGRVAFLEKELKRSINKSKPYFDARVEFTRVLENQKDLIRKLESEIKQKKKDYAASLKRLEQISNEIHESRQLGQRESGVGSDNPGPPKKEQPRPPPPEQITTILPVPDPPETIRKKSSHDRRNSRKPSADRKISPNLHPVVYRADSGGGRDRSVSAPPEPHKAGVGAGISSGVILLATQLSEYDFLADVNRARAFSLPPDDYDCHYKTTPDGVKPFPTPPPTPGHEKCSPRGSYNNGEGNGTPSDVQNIPTPLNSAASSGNLNGSRPSLGTIFEDQNPVGKTASLGGENRSLGGLSRSATEEDILGAGGSDSDASSLFSHNLQDELIEKYMRCHGDLIDDIEDAGACSSAEEGFTNPVVILGHQININNLAPADLLERSSGSGEEA